MTQEERQSTTAARIATRRLPNPKWVSVHHEARLIGRCDGCGDEIVMLDYAFIVALHQSVTLRFHDECFDVYNRSRYR